MPLRRMLGVMNAKNKKQRKKAYADLLKVTGKTLGYASRAIGVIKNSPSADPMLLGLTCHIEHYAQLTAQVVQQTERRAMFGENVRIKKRWYLFLNRCWIE